MDIIKSFKTISAPEATEVATRPVAPVARKMASPEDLASVARAELSRRKTGLLAVYGSAGKSNENVSDIENALRKRNVGNLFDAVA